MNKIRLIKTCQFLYRCSQSGIMACGICMTLILAMISLTRLERIISSVKVDFTVITSGWYPYLWIALIVIYLIGSLVVIGKWLKTKPISNLSSVGSVRSGKEIKL